MQWVQEIDIPKLDPGIHHQDQLLMIGSCFTTNMGQKLQDHLFHCTYNPSGIVFDPLSIARHLRFYHEGHEVTESDLKQQNELYTQWDFHGSFSQLSANESLALMNNGIEEGKQALIKSKFLIITLGTSYAYYYKSEKRPVSNCHRFPADSFNKVMLSAEESFLALSPVLLELINNYGLQVVLTISPVRHAKDGVVNNTRSKARLVELCQRLEQEEGIYYFPSYELQMDVLRDYRFYDADLAHPNYAATQYIFERFCEACMLESTKESLLRFKSFSDANKHKSRYPDSEAHQKFLQDLEKQKMSLVQDYPWVEKLI